MLNEFNRYLREQLRQQTTLHPTIIAEEISGVLTKHRSTVYKKLKGETAFSLEEIIMIARHFNISFDGFTLLREGDYERIFFDYSLPSEQARNPVRFLEKIGRDMERIAALPNPFIRYATNELPIFHSLICRRLLAFKLYVWSRTNWAIPEMLHKPFNADQMYELWPQMEELRLAAYQAYEKIPSVEYWPRSVLVNILGQISYYAGMQLFADPKEPQQLYGELLEALKSREALAAAGYKTPTDNGAGGPKFEVFINEIAYTNNIILIYNNEQPVAVYATMDNPNFMRSSDPFFCARMHEWANQIEDCSFSTETERHRASLFGELKKQVEAAMKG